MKHLQMQCQVLRLRSWRRCRFKLLLTKWIWHNERVNPASSMHLVGAASAALWGITNGQNALLARAKLT